jgi:aminoglycoside phosphotransferase (APT) family kinase protein
VERATVVHSTDLSRVAGLVGPSSPFYAPTPTAAAAQVHRLQDQDVLGSAQAKVLLAILDRFWAALPDARVVLNHGDLSPVNALWHRGQVSALLDFEYAVIAPVELDANELLGAAFNPNQEEELLADPTGAGRRGLREAATRMVLPVLERPGAADRLLGYAVLLQLWATHRWLTERDDHQESSWQPQLGLAALAAGDGGHLASVLAVLP